MKRICLLLMILMVVTIDQNKADAQRNNNLPGTINLPDNVLSTLKKDHPRLLVNSYNDFEVIKAKIPTDPYLQACYASLKKRADSLVAAPVKQYIITPPNYLLGVSRAVLDRSYTLGLMYRLTGDKRYKDRLWAELQNAAQFTDWNPKHFLDVAEMTHAFAIAYDWLYDTWDYAQRQTLKKAIIDNGLTPGNQYYNKTFTGGMNWTNVDNNWNQVCNGGLTLGALAIADEAPQISGPIIQNAVSLVPVAMKHFAPDGAWFEGPLYLQYALRYNVAMIAALQSALGTDFGLSKQPGFSNAGKFIIAMSGATGITFNYGDCPEEVISVPEMFWFAKKFNEPLCANYEKQWSKYTALDMLWYTSGSDNNSIGLNNYFRGAEVASIRSSWDDDNAIFVGFKAGKNGTNHGHLDIGSFVLEKNGQRWVSDPGPDDYGLTGYFNSGRAKASPRWAYYKLGTEGHSTLVVKDGNDDNQNTNASTRIIKFNTDPNNSFGIMDLTPAYTPDLQSSLRGIRLINKKQVVVQDEVRGNQSSDVSWQIQTRANIQLSPDQRTATLSLGGKQLQAQILSPNQGRFEVQASGKMFDREEMMKSQASDGLKRLVVHLTNASNSTIAVIFKDVNAASEYNVQPIKSW
jgi:hypothetical protein